MQLAFHTTRTGQSSLIGGTPEFIITPRLLVTYFRNMALPNIASSQRIIIMHYYLTLYLQSNDGAFGIYYLMCFGSNKRM